MSEAKLYYVSETGLVEGEAPGRLRVYLAADYDALKAERDQLRAELAAIRAREPRDYLRGRQRLDQEWCELQNLKAAYAPQPKPDVQPLVEALEMITKLPYSQWGDMEDARVSALQALAAYRKAP